MDKKMSITDLSVINDLFGSVDMDYSQTGERKAADYSAYLNVEDKISSLEKLQDVEFKKKPVFEVSLGGYEKAKHKRLYVLDRIAGSIVRPLLKKGLMEELHSYLLPEFIPEVQMLDDRFAYFSSLQSAFKASDVACIKFTGKNGKEKLTYTVLSGRISVQKHFGHMRSFTVVDAGMFYAELIILSEINKYFYSLQDKSQESRQDDPVYFYAHKNCSKFFGRDLYLLNREEAFVNEFRSVTKEYDINVVCSCKEKREYDRMVGSDNNSAFLMHVCFTWVYFLISSLAIPSEWILLEDCPTYYLVDLFLKIRSEYEIDRQTAEYQRNQSGEYAASFQEKKNIPLYVQKAMKNSMFNNHFGSVEFDADVDLAKIKEIEKEFEALSYFFGQGKLSDYSLRFRRLGKHHAAGLYFAAFCCLCVDINSPSSMGHEYFHLIDFKHNSLSRKHSFEEIRSLYEKLVTAAVKKDEVYLKIWNGNTKYNKKYYLEPTEIFARCGELYLTSIKGVSNSLVNPGDSHGFAYPKDPEFLSKVELYFNDIFSVIKPKEDAA